jgi:predicted dehydrogenase
VELAAICDIVPSKIEAFKERYHLPEDFPSFTDYHDLLNVEGLDYVDICTPNYLHSIIAVDALKKGLNVFTEKPDAVSVAEVTRMKEAADESGKVLMAMRNNRHRNTAKFLKRDIADGNMGDIYCGRCGWIRRRGIPGKGGWFTTKEQSGGGPLIDLGVHMIDLAIWLMGNPTPVAVSGCTYSKFANNDVSDSANSAYGDKNDGGTFDVEDLAMGFIRFDNGACMQIEFSWASNIEAEQRFVELRGTKAGAVWNSLDDKLKIFTEEYGQTVDVLPNIQAKLSGHAANLRHFADVLLNGAEPIFVPQQGYDMIKILEGFYRSAAEGREIAL